MYATMNNKTLCLFLNLYLIKYNVCLLIQNGFRFDFLPAPEGGLRWSVCASAVLPATWRWVARGDDKVSAEGKNLRELAAVEKGCGPCEASSHRKIVTYTTERWTAR